jgi:ribose/xylose/arabinose/galactoside ABC-type transport system permease subunit
MQDEERVGDVEPRNPLLSRISALGPAYGAGIAFAVLVVGNVAFTPGFATVANLSNLLVQVTPTILVAVGVTLVIATGGIDLSVGSVMAIASAVAATLLGYGPSAAIVGGLAAALLAGAFSGAVIAGFGIQPIIVTLALLISGRGIAQVISEGGQLIAFSNPSFELLGRGQIGGVPLQVLVMASVVYITAFAMRATSFGRYVIAVGGNEAAARLAGVKTGRTKVAVYAVSGLLAGLAGLTETARLAASDASKVGLNIELDAIAAVVVGGTPLTGGRATVVGTVVGALIMQVISASFNMNNIPFSWSLVLKAAIILFAVYVQRPKLV